MATTYFIDNIGGNNAAAGTASGTAWKNVAKLLATGVPTVSGDKVLFKKGCIWNEALSGLAYYQRRGRAANPIVFSTYGTSTRAPSIRQLKVFDSWAPAVSGALPISANGIAVWSTPYSGAVNGGHQLWKSDTALSCIAWGGTRALTFNDIPSQAGRWSWTSNKPGGGAALYYCDSANPSTLGTFEGVGNGVRQWNSVLANSARFDGAIQWWDYDHWRVQSIDFQGGVNYTLRIYGLTAGRFNDWLRFHSCTFSKTTGQCIEVIGHANKSAQCQIELSACRFTNVPSATWSGAALGANAVRLQGAGNAATPNSGHYISFHDNVFSMVNHGIQIGTQLNTSNWVAGVIQRNLFVKCSDDAIWSPGGKRTAAGHRLTIINNIAVGGGDGGFELQANAASAQRYVRIANNVLASNGADGLMIQGADKTVSAYNNVIVNNYRNYPALGNGGGASLDAWLTNNSHGNGPRINNNLYFTDGRNAALKIRWCSTNANAIASGTFTQYKAATGQDASGKNVDPGFIKTSYNGSPGSFRPRINSPLVNAGATVTGVTDDYSGTARPVGVAYDIGAFEGGVGTLGRRGPQRDVGLIGWLTV